MVLSPGLGLPDRGRHPAWKDLNRLVWWAQGNLMSKVQRFALGPEESQAYMQTGRSNPLE